MLARSASAASMSCSPTCRPTSCSATCRPAARQGRARGRARCWGRWRRRTSPPASVPFFVGAGAYKHHVPATVDHLIQRSEFLTSYTPYQPEIAQGTLQYLFEFQTQVALLTGMEVANASMYDGSTATAEAVLMAHRVTRGDKAVLSGNLHPHYRETIAHAVAHGRRRARRGLPPAPAGAEDLARADRRRDRPASWCRRPTSSAICTISRRSPRRRTPAGALLIAVVTEAVSLGAGRSRPARWAPTSSSARASRSATR